MIGGIVSFCLLHAFEWVLDWGSSRTNGAFGTTTPSIPANAHHGLNPKDSAHEIPKPNGKAAVDEEVSPSAASHDSSSFSYMHGCADVLDETYARVRSSMSAVISDDIP